MQILIQQVWNGTYLGIQSQVQLRLSESDFSENPQGIHMHTKVEKHCPEKTHSNLAEAKVLVCKPG